MGRLSAREERMLNFLYRLKTHFTKGNISREDFTELMGELIKLMKDLEGY